MEGTGQNLLVAVSKTGHMVAVADNLLPSNAPQELLAWLGAFQGSSYYQLYVRMCQFLMFVPGSALAHEVTTLSFQSLRLQSLEPSLALSPPLLCPL